MMLGPVPTDASRGDDSPQLKATPRILNRPTPEGEEMGRQLVRLLEADVQDRALTDVLEARCSSCAFRVGTIPNGCPTTIMDALKCVMEGQPFYCHMGDEPLCAGWVAWRLGTEGIIRCPWAFSSEEPQ